MNYAGHLLRTPIFVGRALKAGVEEFHFYRYYPLSIHHPTRLPAVSPQTGSPLVKVFLSASSAFTQREGLFAEQILKQKRLILSNDLLYASFN